jgi:hypothetical protein
LYKNVGDTSEFSSLTQVVSEMDFFYMAQVEVCIIMLEPMYYAFKNCSL